MKTYKAVCIGSDLVRRFEVVITAVDWFAAVAVSERLAWVIAHDLGCTESLTVVVLMEYGECPA